MKLAPRALKHIVHLIAHRRLRCAGISLTSLILAVLLIATCAHPYLQRRACAALPLADDKLNDAKTSASAASLVEVGGKCAHLAATLPRDTACNAPSMLTASAQLKIVTYNIRWRSGDELKEIIRFLKNDAEIGGARIIGLQEVDRKRKRSGHTNTARHIAEALGMNYVWAAPPSPEGSLSQSEASRGEKVTASSTEEEETGVAILSPYPLADVTRLVLPHEGPERRRRVALGATVYVDQTPLRVYSVHAETRVSVDEKTEQLKAVLDDLAFRPKQMAAVVLGDFNTWQPDSKRDCIKLFTAANFVTPFPPGQPTFRYILVKMRLDWIWLRGFTHVTSYGIARHIKISDHYPLWLDAEIKKEAKAEE